MKARLIATVALIALTVIIIQQGLVYQNQYQQESFQSSKKLRINHPYYDNYIKAKLILTFDEFQHKYSKNYPNQEEKIYRMNVFKKSIKEVIDHNLLYQQGKSSFYKGINKYADLTDEQFSARYNWKLDHTLRITNQCTGAIMDAPNPPIEQDWGNKVTQVKEQGTCGKDWAIVASDAVQSLYALKMGSLPNLSTQQLVECSQAYGNEGCSGGFMDQAFQYIIDFGIATDKSYPVRSPPGVCKYGLNMKFTTITKCARVPSKSYSKLLSAIVQQPVSVAVDQNPDMKLFANGIYDGKCTSNLNHGMLLVGYGGKQTDEYFWRLKNTLGTEWGDGGYISIRRVESDGDGTCGIQIWPSVPQNIA